MVADNTNARRSENRQTAYQLALMGIAVFVSDDKTPLIRGYTKLDKDHTKEEIERITEEYEAKHGEGEKPAHIGCTTDPAAIKKMFTRFPDAVTSISCGPSGLVVLDADAKDDGPAKLAKFFEENGGMPEGAVVVATQSGGQHIYFKNDGSFTNKAGLLKKECGTDVRGVGGQTVAPGSIRVNGKTYGGKQARVALCRAVHHKTLPVPADYIREAIGASADTSSNEQVTPTREREVIAEIENADWEDPKLKHAFDPDVGDYDLEKLKKRNESFAKLYETPNATDISTNRFKAAKALLAEWPDMSAPALALFFEQWEGAGEWTENLDKNESGKYDNRQVAREWLKNTGTSKASDGSAFDAVEISEDDEEERAAEAYDKKITEERNEALGLKPGSRAFARDMAYFIAPDYIIENVFVPGTLGVVHGSSNVGKTFAIIHMGECVAGGLPWFDLRTDQGGVIYCYGEGAENMQNRMYAYRKRFPSDQPGMWMHDGIPNIGLKLEKAIKSLEAGVKEANDAYLAAGMPPVKIMFIDTWAKAVAGINENDTGDVQPILNALRALARRLRICIILIHHSGKDTTLGLRGSSAMLADVDVNLEIVDAKTAEKQRLGKLRPGHLAIVSPKMREGRKTGIRQFKLEEVEIGTNKWGGPVTSVVAIPFLDTPSAGTAFDVVDDEPASTTDALTPEQNREADDRRRADCEKLADVVRKQGAVRRTDERAIKLQSAADAFARLGAFRLEHASNFVRDFKTEWFCGDAEIDLNGGTLRLEEVTGRGKSTMLVFKIGKPGTG